MPSINIAGCPIDIKKINPKSIVCIVTNELKKVVFRIVIEEKIVFIVGMVVPIAR